MKILSKGIIPFIIIVSVRFPNCSFYNVRSTVLRQQTSSFAKSLPMVAHDWETLRRKNCVYVDKTMFLEKLLDGENPLYVLPRPRRFGKSVFAQMIKSFFLGEDFYFEGTAIYDRGNVIPNRARNRNENTVNHTRGEWIRYPVIFIDFSEFGVPTTGSVAQQLKNFEKDLVDTLIDIAEQYGVKRKTARYNLKHLIIDLKKKYRLPVIIIIDEYDIVINRAMDYNQKELAKGLVKIIDNFYLIIKSRFSDIGFAWVSGVTKLALNALHSGPNSFVNLQYNDDFATIVGFTEEEIRTYFASHLQDFGRTTNKTEENIMKDLIEWYDGYRFSLRDQTAIFNPISIIECLRHKSLMKYWTATSSMKSMKHLVNQFFDESGRVNDNRNITQMKEDLFENYDRMQAEIPLHIYMFQTGYLTIKDYDRETQIVTLDYPNKEIESTLQRYIESYVPSRKMFIFELTSWTISLKKAMINGDTRLAMKIIHKIGFPIFRHPLDESMPAKQAKFDVTRRLFLIFRFSNIEYIETKKILSNDTKKVNGDIDMQTTGLPTNYIIEVKYGSVGSRKAVKQIVNYYQKFQYPFLRTIEHRKKFNLLILNFNNTRGGRLFQWVCIPYKNGRFNADEVTSSSLSLGEQVKNDFRKSSIHDSNATDG